VPLHYVYCKVRLVSVLRQQAAIFLSTHPDKRRL
jgi:hypothetical protein